MAGASRGRSSPSLGAGSSMRGAAAGASSPEQPSTALATRLAHNAVHVPRCQRWPAPRCLAAMLLAYPPASGLSTLVVPALLAPTSARLIMPLAGLAALAALGTLARSCARRTPHFANPHPSRASSAPERLH